jgi:ATP-dependent Clp protease ATP-binding subunit ClpB
VARIIGAPPGYVGYDEGGYLTEAVRRRPYTVVLFDEIEKAHPDVFNVLLQVLDDGRITDGKGRTVNCANTVIIMTSNIGSHHISQMTGASTEEVRDVVMEEVRAQFRPEFLNRLDEVIVFHSLERKHLDRIVEIQLNRLRPLLGDRDLTLHFTSEVIAFLANRGFDPVYGARPLKRAIQTHVTNVLAKQILSGEFPPGSQIESAVEDGALVFR